MSLGVPPRLGGQRGGLDVEGNAELLEGSAELGDIVAVHQIVGVLVQEVDRGTGEHDAHGILARHHPERDAHGLVRPVGDARILGDDDENGLAIRHAVSSTRGSDRCR